MVYGLNQPQNQNLSYGAIKDVAPKQVVEKLPENIQNFDVKDSFENNSTVQMVTSKSKDLNTGLMTAGIWGGFIGLRSLLDKVTAGDWDKSLFGRITNFGDALSNGINKVTFGLSRKAADGLKNNTSKTAKFLTDRFDFAASFKTPFKYEATEAIRQSNGMAGRLFFDDIKNAVGRFDEKKLPKIFESISEFKGLDAKGIIEKFEKIAVNPLGKENREIVEKIMKAFEQSGETFTIKSFNGSLPFIGDFKIPMTGKFNPLRIFQVKMPGSSIANKYRALSKTSAGKTMLGKNLAYALGTGTEGLTSCIVGGKLAPLIQAMVLANAIKSTIEAPKGEKLATFMDEMVYQAAFFMTMPYTTKSLASVGGALKYMGMTGEVDKAFLNKVKNSPELLKKFNLVGKDLTKLTKGERQILNVAHYKDAIEKLNSKVAKNAISGVEYQAQIKNIKKIFKGNSKWYQKPFRLVGQVLGMGYKSETIKPLATKMSKGAVTVKNLANKLKAAGGGGLRFYLILFAIPALFSKPIKAITNKIFGKPYDPEAKKAEEEKKAQEEALKNLNMTEDEMIAKLQAHPEIIQMFQSNPEAMAEIEKNPMLLVQLLASLPDAPQNTTQAPGAGLNGNKFSNTNGQSDILQKYINNPNNKAQGLNNNAFNQTQVQNQQIKGLDQNPAQTSSVQNTQNTQRNYIPSSKPFNASDNMQNIKMQNNTQTTVDEGLSNIPISGAAGQTANDTANSLNPNQIQNETITNPNVQAALLKADRAMDEAMKLL